MPHRGCEKTTGRHAATNGGNRIGTPGQQANADPALSWFEINEVLPFDLKRLKALLRQEGIGRLEVKKRGVPHDPAQVIEQLRVPGDRAATLFLTRIKGAVTAIVCRRLMLT